MPESSLSDDLLLSNVPEHEGYKVLGGVVLYQKLGQGGMGAVYRGKHLRLEVDVALKVMATPAGLHPDHAANYLQRFLREAKTAASVKHQNLIRVYDVNSERGVHFLIMDFVDGESAGDRLKRRGVTDAARLTEQEAVEIALGAAEGLAAAHRRGIVHRDVKPDNILIDKEGNVVVADLGLAKAYGAGESDSALSMGVSLTQQAMGTPHYMAPEQTRSAKDVGPQADVWSLGVTLYQLASGGLPWNRTDLVELIGCIRQEPADDPKLHCSELSEGFCAIIDRALQKEPADRYADCGEMAKALRAHLDSVKQSTESVLPDAEAGKTKMAIATVTPPPSKTLTLIGKSLLTPPDSERLTARAPADTSPTAPAQAPALGRTGLPGWVTPVAAGGLVLLGLIIWAVLGMGGKGTQTDPLEAEAQRFLGRVTAVADDGRLEEAAKLIEEAGTEYDATAAGPKIASLAETISRKLTARRRREEEQKERARQEEARRRAAAMAQADGAEKAGDLNEALRLLRQELAERDDPDLRMRVEKLERAVAALRLIEQGSALEKAGKFEKARDAYRRAIMDAVGEGRRQAEERLAEVERRIRIEETVADIGRKVKAREWRAAWRSIQDARKAGITDPRLDDLSQRVVEALAPPKTLVGALGIEFTLVPGGMFNMGSRGDGRNEKPVHKVTVSTFYIGRHEVTRAQFEAFRSGRRAVPEALSDAGRRPVVDVTWNSAVAFCRYLAEIDGAGAAYRLPSEAEWEYAARGSSEQGTGGRQYPWGDEAPAAEHANFVGGADGFADLAPVGSFPEGATPLGVMDLAGNAAEWCSDWYGLYRPEVQKDPVGPALGRARVVRGGAYVFESSWARTAARAGRRPDDPSDCIGFRVVRELTPEEKKFHELAGGEHE